MRSCISTSLYWMHCNYCHFLWGNKYTLIYILSKIFCIDKCTNKFKRFIHIRIVLLLFISSGHDNFCLTFNLPYCSYTHSWHWWRRELQQQLPFTFANLRLPSQVMLTWFDQAAGWNQHLEWRRLLFLRAETMPSPVAKAMIESYALMIMVMGTFFLYFCGMVWAFCNPKLSNAEEAGGTEKQALQHGDDWLDFTSHHPQQAFRCACMPPQTAEGLTHTTYVNFWDDADGLLSDCSTFCHEDHGITNHIESDISWTA